MTKTKEWAESLGIDTQDILPPAENYEEPCKRTAAEVAIRTIVIHSIAAAGCGLDRNFVIEWLKNQELWGHVSPREESFLLSRKPSKFMEEERKGVQWLQEAQWALLWTIQKIESLGLPVKTCNAIRMVDDIMPMPGSDIKPFISSVELRPVAEIRAEEERIQKLFHHAQEAYEKKEMPDDLIYGVLFQRYYAFRWLNSEDEWDDVKTD